MYSSSQTEQMIVKLAEGLWRKKKRKKDVENQSSNGYRYDFYMYCTA
jgi:hypothetical protein